MNIGYLATGERRYQDALGWLDDGLQAARRLDDPYLVFTVRTNQGIVTLFLHEFGDAAQALCEALALCHPAAAEHVVDETLLGWLPWTLRAGPRARGPAGRGGHRP